MKKIDTDKLITKLAVCTIIMFIGFCILLGVILYNTYTDYKCTQLPDEQFFSETKCKPYWRFRK